MGKAVNVVAVAAAGFIAGMLLAPKSGKETRQDLMDKAQDAKKAAGEKADHVKDAMHEGMNALHKNAKNVGSEIADFAESTKHRADRIMREEKGMVDEAKTRANRVADKNRTDDTDI